MIAGYPTPPPVPMDGSSGSILQWARQIVSVLQGVMQGRVNITGEVTLAAGTETVIKDPRLSSQSVLHIDALTPSAAGLAWHALPADRSKGEWTIRHEAGPAGRTIRYAVLG